MVWEVGSGYKKKEKGREDDFLNMERKRLMKKKLTMCFFALCIMVLFSIMESSSQAVVYAGGCGSEKVTICHIPPGNPENAQTLTVSINAWNGHLRNNGGHHNGCHLGACEVNGDEGDEGGEGGGGGAALDVKSWQEAVSAQ